jgi:hypothetical protein
VKRIYIVSFYDMHRYIHTLPPRIRSHRISALNQDTSNMCRSFTHYLTISLSNLVKHLPFEFSRQRSISGQMNFLTCPSLGPRTCSCSSWHTNAKSAFSSDILNALNVFKDGQHVKTHLPSPSGGAILFLSRRPRRARTCSQKLYFEALYTGRPTLRRASEERNPEAEAARQRAAKEEQRGRCAQHITGEEMRRRTGVQGEKASRVQIP